MTGLFGFGGSSSKTDRGKQLEGFGDIESAINYFKSLMSGDPTKVNQALAPQIKVAQDQGEQKLKTLSEFGTRSGGTSAEANKVSTDVSSSVQNLIDTLIPTAATEVGAFGSTLASQAGNSRQTSLQQNNMIGSGIMSLFKNIADLIPGGAGDFLGTLLSGV